MAVEGKEPVSASQTGGAWRRGWARWRPYVVPVALLLAVTLPHLGQGDWRGDAGWYSAIGLDAWRTGNLWTLRAGPGEFYFNKPPLVFWIHGLFLHVFGPTLWAARLPTVLAACGCVIAAVGIARVWVGRWPAMLAGCVLALTYEFFRRNREISLDLWQLMFMLGGVWAIAVGVKHGRAGGAMWALLAGVPLGLALMTKPLMALAVLPVLAVWMIWASEARRVWWVALTGLVAVVVASPWHVSMAMLHGSLFTGQYFGAEIAARAAGEAVGGQLEEKPVWFYLALLGSTYWPWLVFVVVGVWGQSTRAGRPPPQIGERRAASGSKQAELFKLAAVWTVAWLIMLTIFADRRPRYALPLYPSLAWMAMVGLLAAAGLRPALRGWMKWALPAAVVGGAIFAALPVKVQGGASKQWVEFFEWVRMNAPTGVHDGAFGGAPGARVYLVTGKWPEPTRDRRERVITEPAEGTLLAYHRRGGRVPGANEVVVFESGDLKITKLGSGGWKPELMADPGE